MTSFTLSSANFGKNLTIAQVTTPVSSPHHQQNFPIELYGSLALLGAGFLAVVRSELKRLDRRRDVEAEQAEKYVRELEAENSRLEAELKNSRNTIMGLRVRLAATSKELEISSGELRSSVGARKI